MEACTKCLALGGSWVRQHPQAGFTLYKILDFQDSTKFDETWSRYREEFASGKVEIQDTQAMTGPAAGAQVPQPATAPAPKRAGQAKGKAKAAAAKAAGKGKHKKGKEKGKGKGKGKGGKEEPKADADAKGGKGKGKDVAKAAVDPEAMRAASVRKKTTFPRDAIGLDSWANVQLIHLKRKQPSSATNSYWHMVNASVIEKSDEKACQRCSCLGHRR